MKTIAIYCGLAALAGAAFFAAAAEYQYEGEWGSYGPGEEQFQYPTGISVNAVNGLVYVGDFANYCVKYFTATGSFLGSFGKLGFSGDGDFCQLTGVQCAPWGDVYTTNACTGHYPGVEFFSAAGTFLGKFNTLMLGPRDVGVYALEAAPVALVPDAYRDYMILHSARGQYLGVWAIPASGRWAISVAPNGVIYLADGTASRVLYYSPDGNKLGEWGSPGTGDGQFDGPCGIEVAADGRVFVADSYNNRVQYFTPAGSFLGKFGTAGSGPGEFNLAYDVAVNGSGSRVYVTDDYNHRVQYFNRDATAVAPASLGKVKALFK
jgi:tripartite motif-containing protein 71